MIPSISVIIPVYNVKMYLKEAIDSIISQKAFLYEVLLIDDGSTDTSGELIEKLYRNLNFIKIFHTENQGQGIARNLGTQHASGDYIYYFDSDDIAIEGLFEKFINLIYKSPDIELFCFSGESFLDKQYSIENVVNPNILSKNAYKRKIEAFCTTGEEAFILLANNHSFFPGPPLYIFKKSILTNNKIYFRDIRYEDEEFTFKLFFHAKETVIVNDVYFKRRIRQGSTMQLKRSFKDILGYIKTIETLNQLKRNKDLKTETKKLLKNKIINLARSIIIIKTKNKIILSKDESLEYKNNLRPIILSSGSLFIFSLKYPIEYKLRKMKKQLFN